MKFGNCIPRGGLLWRRESRMYSATVIANHVKKLNFFIKKRGKEIVAKKEPEDQSSS